MILKTWNNKSQMELNIVESVHPRIYQKSYQNCYQPHTEFFHKKELGFEPWVVLT